jgi:hypothetical protein
MIATAVSGMQANTTYDVEIRAYANGAWTAYGPVCQLTIGSAFTGNGSGSLALDNSFGQTNRSDILVYPNPNRGKLAYLEMVDLQEGMREATVIVYDIYGKQVFGESFIQEGTSMARQLSFQYELMAGVYIVSVEIDGQRTTTRLVVQ